MGGAEMTRNQPASEDAAITFPFAFGRSGGASEQVRSALLRS